MSAVVDQAYLPTCLHVPTIRPASVDHHCDGEVVLGEGGKTAAATAAVLAHIANSATRDALRIYFVPWKNSP